MSNRSVNFLAAAFAAVLAGANLATVKNIHAQAAADACQTAPGDKKPAGSRWRYKLERGTGRQCWYLKDENEKTARAAPQAPLNLSPEAAPSAAEAASAAADPVPPPPRPVRKSVANAHAELTPPRTRIEQDSGASSESQTTGIATTARAPNSPAAIGPDTAAPSSAAPTRWLDTTGMNAPSGFRLAAAEPAASPPENDQPTLQPATPPVVPAAAADPSMTKQTASMQMLLLVMAGALAIAGITASLLFRFSRARARRRLKARRERRWDAVRTQRPPRDRRPTPSMLPDEEAPAWRRAPAQEPRAPDDPQRQVTEMLSRLARSAQH
ncbi:MAG: hypothetical protein ABI561_12680 [Bradyrhizobium sp.]